MPIYEASVNLPYQDQQIFDLVRDIEKYPQFLPWCSDLSIIERRQDGSIIADMKVGYKKISKTYRSLVNFQYPGDFYKVSVKSIDNLFNSLNNHWIISKVGPYETKIDFFIDLSLKSKILNKMLSKMFDSGAKTMMKAFCQRADQLYGEKQI